MMVLESENVLLVHAVCAYTTPLPCRRSCFTPGTCGREKVFGLQLLSPCDPCRSRATGSHVLLSDMNVYSGQSAHGRTSKYGGFRMLGVCRLEQRIPRARLRVPQVRLDVFENTTPRCLSPWPTCGLLAFVPFLSTSRRSVIGVAGASGLPQLTAVDPFLRCFPPSSPMTTASLL